MTDAPSNTPPADTPPAAAPSAFATRSVKEASAYLVDQLVLVVKRHMPQIEPVLRGFAAGSKLTDYEMGRALQAQGILFQLVSIAEQAYAMRRRRHIERERGHDQLLGTFDQVLAGAARAGVSADEIRAQLQTLRIRPVITAHPTEARRVSILRRTAEFICCCAISNRRAGPTASATRSARSCATRSNCCS